MPDFAITTDYITSRGSPLPYLQRIAQAGWKWIHWCHHWNDDHLYSPAELTEIAGVLQNINLRVLDIHGSAGRWRRWDSRWRFLGQAGVTLVRNRIEMAARLGCDVVIMHPARQADANPNRQRSWDAVCQSIDDLLPDLRRHRVRLAVENMEQDNFDELQMLADRYAPEELGICYDPGHGNIAGNGLGRIAQLAHRLIALHLNDNDGHRDLHQLSFQGTVDWPTLANLIRQSGYTRPAISVEVGMKHSGINDEQEFLTAALKSADRFGQMLASQQS